MPTRIEFGIGKIVDIGKEVVSRHTCNVALIGIY